MLTNSRRFQLIGALGLILAGLLVALFHAAPAYAGGVVGNGTPDSCTETAFNAKLADGGNITFNCGGAKTITFTGYKQIGNDTNGHDVTIDGGGLITLSGGNSVSLFQVSANRSLMLQNITLANGLSTVLDGGAIENFGTTSIFNSRLTDNRSKSTGGAILNFGTLNLNTTTLSNNKAAKAGGGLYNENGVININSSQFLGNVVTGTVGTGGGLESFIGKVSIQDSTFSHNSSHAGGAIHVNTDTVLFINSSLIISNSAEQGGGIGSFTSTVTISQTTITLNQATTDVGGGIMAEQGTVSLTDSTVSNNKAKTHGGGIESSIGNLNLNRVTLNGNTAGDKGAGVHSSSVANLTNVTVSDNHTAGNGGGGIYQIGGFMVMNFVSVVSNTAVIFGGGIYNDGNNTMNLQNTLLANNNVGNCDGNGIVSLGHNMANDNHCNFFFNQPTDQSGTNISLPLGPLTNNGGFTQTHLPLAGNPAINGGVCVGGITTDQRKLGRPFGATCDVGAVEGQPIPVYLPLVVKNS